LRDYFNLPLLVLPIPIFAVPYLIQSECEGCVSLIIHLTVLAQSAAESFSGCGVCTGLR